MNPLTSLPPWRQLLILALALPAVVAVAVLAFTWPASKIQPRDLAIGVVGSTSATQPVSAGLEAAQPGAFDFRLFTDERAARQAIQDRDVYGALDVTPTTVTVLEASAASPTVAQLLTATGDSVAAAATKASPGGPKVTTSVVDVVPLARDDSRGAVLSGALLPLSFAGMFIAAAVGLLVRFRPAWREITALIGLSAVVGAVVYLIAQVWLGALPDHGFETWAAISLAILAISGIYAGFVALAGATGLGIAGALMLFLGNPFAGATSAPEMLPDAVRYIGQLLPPGAGINLLRSTAYFDGNGAGRYITVLAAWVVIGLAMVVVGHHTPIRFAASRLSEPQRADADGDGRPGEPVLDGGSRQVPEPARAYVPVRVLRAHADEHNAKHIRTPADALDGRNPGLD